MSIKITKAFNLMLLKKPVKLSKLGKSQLNECWEKTGNDEWYIVNVGIDDTIRLLNEQKHLIFDNATLNWLILGKS